MTVSLSISYLPPVPGATKNNDTATNVHKILQLDPSVLQAKYQVTKRSGQKSALETAIEESWLKGEAL